VLCGRDVSCQAVNVGCRPTSGSPGGSDVMLEGVVGGREAVAGIKNVVRPMMSPATSQRLVQLSNDLTASRSAPLSPQGSNCSRLSAYSVF